MTVLQLKAILENTPDDAFVYVKLKGFFHEVKQVDLHWDSDEAISPTLVIEPEPKL
jgi:hypothetical protein